MPIYEYECTSCGKRFELKQKFSDPPVTTCDQFSCPEAKPVQKIISAPAIMFKGTGWYVTDYSDKLKDPNAKSENKGEKTEVKSSSGDSEKKSSTDSKTSSDSPSSNTSAANTSNASTSSSSTSTSSSSTSSNS